MNCSLCSLPLGDVNQWVLPDRIMEHYRANHGDLIFVIYRLGKVKT